MAQLAKPVEGGQMRSHKRRETAKHEKTTGLAPSGKICWLQLWQGKAAPLKLQESQPNLRRHQTKKSTELAHAAAQLLAKRAMWAKISPGTHLIWTWAQILVGHF